MERSDLAVPPEKMVLLLGAPRSGTTWLGKIFDSHPDVLYRHEPDTIDRGGPLPKVVRSDDIPVWSAEARAYLLRLAALRRLKTVGQLPIFGKRYRPAVQKWLFTGEIYLLRALDLLPATQSLAARLPVPELTTGRPRVVVIKSVSGCGCAGLYAAALPQARIVFLMRSPYGQIASMLEGTGLRKLDGAQAAVGLDLWPEAARYGLTETTLPRLTLAEQLAWMWAVQNEKALADLGNAASVRLVTYSDLRAHPQEQARALFDFSGLDWSAQTEAFLAASTRPGVREQYYGVQRNTSVPETKWRTVLSLEDRRRIAAIVRQTSLARYLDPDAELA